MKDEIQELKKEIEDLKDKISELEKENEISEERCDKLSGAMTDIYLITKDF